MRPIFLDFISETLQKGRTILAVDCFSFLKIINENYSTRNPKNWLHDLINTWNCLRLLWSRLSAFSSLFWSFFRLRCQVMDPRYTHGCVSTQKICFFCGETSPNTRLEHPHDVVFVLSEQTQHQSCAQLFHAQIFNRCVLYSTLWHAYHVCYLEHFQLTVIQYHFVDLLHHFWRSHLTWSTAAVFILAAPTASFKLFHTILYCCKRKEKTSME